MKRVFLIFLFLIISLSYSYSQMLNPVVLISGKTYNERTMQEIEATIIYEALPSGKRAGVARTNPETGEYKIILPSGKKYGFMAYVEGYYGVSQFMDLTKLDKYTEINEQYLYLAPIEVDQVIRLNNVFFKENTSKLLQEAYPELNRFIKILHINKKIKVEISAHTDNQGDFEKNIKLSTERATEISRYLIYKGIKEKRLSVNGYGSTQPVAFNTTEEGRKRNTRVAFKITSLK